MVVPDFPACVPLPAERIKKIPLHSIEWCRGIFCDALLPTESRSLSPETLSVDGGILGVALDEIAARLHIVAH